MGKSTWVYSHTQGLFLLVAYDMMYHGYYNKIASVLLWMRIRPWGVVLLSYLFYGAFVGMWPWYWHVIELSVMWLQNYFAYATWTWFVITLWTPMYVSYLWNICELWCNMWLVMLNHVWSWLYVGWFEILCGFIRLPGLYGLKYDGLITSVIAIVLVLL
jgi:hypothetical protein